MKTKIKTSKLFFLSFLFLVTFLVACEADKANKKNVALERQPQEWLLANGVPLGYYTYEQFEKLLKGNNDTTYVVNFWATWCAPCVKELPHLQQLYEQYKDQKVHLILVSLDVEKNKEHQLYPFLKKNLLKGEVLLLSQQGMSEWTRKINGDWDGSLPATLLYKGAKQQFYPQSFEYDELEIKLRRFMNL